MYKFFVVILNKTHLIEQAEKLDILIWRDSPLTSPELVDIAYKVFLVLLNMSIAWKSVFPPQIEKAARFYCRTAL